AYTPKARRRPRPMPAAPAATPAPELSPGAERWRMTLKTPMGPQEMTLQLVRRGETFTGRIDSPMGSEAIGDGKIAGDTLSWTMGVKQPAKLKLSFEARVQGETLAG